MCPADTRWGRLADAADPQFGGFTLAQSLEAGFSRHERAGLVQRGTWVAVLPGIFRDATTPETPDLLRWAAFAWSKGGIVSHRSAAELWGLPGIVAPRPEVTVSRQVAPRHPRVVVHRTTAMPERRWMRGGVHVTGPDRTIVDLAAVVEPRVLESAVDHAIREHLVHAEGISRELDRLGTKGRAGAAALERLLDGFASDSASESILEQRVARLLRAAGVPPFVPQHSVVIEGRRYRLDIAWPAQRVALECDGRRHHSDAVVFTSDRQRSSALTAAGWRVLVATWRDVRAPADLVRRVLATLTLTA